MVHGSGKKSFSNGVERILSAQRLRQLKQRIHIWLVILAAMLILRQGAAEGSPFNVDSWSTADGLPQSSVIAMTQTRDGYLWLGTLNGLVRFDGSHFTVFNVNNTPGLPSDRIVFLYEDSRRNLWAGTGAAGLCMIREGVVKNFETGGAGGKIIFAWEDETGAVWFCAADGRIFCWRNEVFDLQPSYSPAFWEKLFKRAFHQVVPGPGAEYWQLENGRVEKWADGKLVKDYSACPWTSSTVIEAFPVVNNSMMLDPNVTAICEDGEGNLVVGTHGAGVYWADGQGGWRHITAEEKSSQNFVLAVGFDHEGNLWVGTDGGGLYRVKRDYLNTPDILPAGVAKSAAEDASGGLWVAYNARGLVYSLSNSVESFGIGRGSNAWSVLVDGQQRVWAGTLGEGLFRFEGGEFAPVSGMENTREQILSLFQGRDGEIWVGSDNGLRSFDGTSWRTFSVSDGLPANAVCALADDAEGDLWIGTSGGLYALRDGKILAVTAPVKDISCLLVDRDDDALWVGTSEHGVARYFKGGWTQYSSTNGLGIDDIGYFIKDDGGGLWIGSYEGLMRVSFTNTAAGTPRIVSSRTFLTRECSSGAQPAAMRAHDGRLWFPTTEGMVSVNPADLNANTNPPPVVLESVLVDGLQQKSNPLSSIWPGTVILRPENDQLEIHFTALDFSLPKRAKLALQFRYKLEGYDKNWTDAGEERVAHFPKLPPGSYVFHVQAGNEDGYWNEAGATLAITVEPPFWRKPGFIAVSVLVFLGVLAGTIYLVSTAKLKRELRALHQKELIEGERARIARDLHDQLGANLTQVTLLGEMAEADKELPAEVEEHARQICETARETTHALDEIVWAVNPANDTLEGLTNYACKYAQDYLALAGVSYRAELPTQLPSLPIPPEVRHNVFLAFKEAVNNVVKHARATEARVRLRLEPGQFTLSVEDNGRGLGDVSGKQLRNGLKNMRKRLADVRGEFEIGPGTNGGTVVQLKVPIARAKA